MTWKDCWISLANIAVFFVLFGSAAFTDDPVNAMRRRVQALCYLGLGILLMMTAALSHMEILVPIGVTP